MSSWKPTKKTGWEQTGEGEERYTRFQQIIKTVLTVVPGGVIRAGKTRYSDDTHTGFWLGVDPSDGLAKLNLGNSTYYVKWTGTRVEIAGSLTTKNGYVQIIDESTSDYGEGIRLLIQDWLTSGALRWDDSAGVMGAVLAAAKNATTGTHLAVNVYPRATGASALLALRCYTKPYGEAGADMAGWSISATGTITGRGNLSFAQLADDVACLFSLNSDYTKDAIQVLDEDENKLFIVEHDGGTYVNQKVGLTPEGGLAVLMTAGEALTRGEVVYVKIASGADGKVWKTVYTDSDAIQMPVGIVSASAAADASVWIVTGGIAYALPESGVTAARGYMAYVSDGESGRLEQSATMSGLTTETWRECGHWLETGSGAGALARLVVQFN